MKEQQKEEEALTGNSFSIFYFIVTPWEGTMRDYRMSKMTGKFKEKHASIRPGTIRPVSSFPAKSFPPFSSSKSTKKTIFPSKSKMKEGNYELKYE